MQAAVGYSENPITEQAGQEAARAALLQAGRTDPCALALLFSTSRHDAPALRSAVAGVIGTSASIVGGGAIGAITNDRFGYAGDQVGLALIWLSEVKCDLVVEKDLDKGAEQAGERLGKQLAALEVRPESALTLLYDSIYHVNGETRMVMATDLLRGIRQALGFLPDITGAGLQGDYQAGATMQWTGADTRQHAALALHFSGAAQIDHVIMHGCRPATGYYTVTRADRQTILEINGLPALEFMDKLLDSAIAPEDYPFFLIFGINLGRKYAEFSEHNYASRLCLAVDKQRGGIVMFEPDMTEGTQFQIMYRSLDLDYMIPRIENIFDRVKGRKPVFALYINCAGRAAGYGGVDLEDAVLLQKTVARRVPLLGIYTGVEIASIGGIPRGLDWTGVFCLFSIPERTAAT
ncbi:MAG: FIST C-terminal domain-containing protein [Deltaproteobacteria bacterium]|jgi:hypothetical protein|nr:FIST C-terminal domain-containing protein [Deltaproteobacteria bacterium]